VQTVSCAEIVRQLEQGGAVLQSNWVDVPERHRSVAAVFDHSWQRLTREEQATLSQLSVFRGGFRQLAAEQVAGASLAILRRLGDRSLLQRDAAGRYHLHELLQRYASRQLAAAGLTEDAEERHLAFFLALAEEGDSQLRGPQAVAWLERLDVERHNLRAALERGLSRPGKVRVMGLRLAVALWQFWYRRGYLTEGREWLAQALAAATVADAELYAALHHGAGVLAWNQGDYVAAHEHYEESLALRRQMGDEQGMAALLNNLGNLALDQGQYTQARAYLEESVEIKRRLGHRVGIATSLANLGVVAYEQGDHEAARDFLEESVLIKRNLGDRSSVAIPLGTLGAIAVEQGDLQTADMLLHESLALKREAGDRWGVAMTLADQGLLALQQGRFDEARRVLAESLALRRQLGDSWSLAHGLQCVGRLAVMEGRAEEAARLWGAALALNEEIGAPLAGSERRQYEMTRDVAVAQIGVKAFEREYGMGRILSLKQALALAEQICSDDL
jgi:tetratricopeptide (TPR) repeat protein